MHVQNALAFKLPLYYLIFLYFPSAFKVYIKLKAEGMSVAVIARSEAETISWAIANVAVPSTPESVRTSAVGRVLCCPLMTIT